MSIVLTIMDSRALAELFDRAQILEFVDDDQDALRGIARHGGPDAAAVVEYDCSPKNEITNPRVRWDLYLAAKEKA